MLGQTPSIRCLLADRIFGDLAVPSIVDFNGIGLWGVLRVFVPNPLRLNMEIRLSGRINIDSTQGGGNSSRRGEFTVKLFSRLTTGETCCFGVRGFDLEMKKINRFTPINTM